MINVKNKIITDPNRVDLIGSDFVHNSVRYVIHSQITYHDGFNFCDPELLVIYMKVWK